MNELLIFALGALAQGVGALVMRRLRGDRATEAIARKSIVLDVHERMQRQGLTPDRLIDFERSLLERTAEKRVIEDRLIEDLKPASDGSSADDPTENMSQQEMNIYARDRAKEMDQKLGAVIAKLREYMDESELTKLDAVQRKWIDYRDADADLAALKFDGGSIQPLVWFGHQTQLTISRIAQLESEYEFRSAAMVPVNERD